MREKHWTDEELLLLLFDVKQPDDHLKTCPDCSRQWKDMRHRYESRPEVFSTNIEERLARQKANIRMRLENKTGRFHPMLVPISAALAALVLIAVLVFNPKPAEQPALETASEDEIIEDIFRTAFNIEPEAIGPVQALFEEPQ